MLSSTPTVGASDGVSSIWKDDISTTCTRSGAGGSRSRMAVPMLPPICASRPAARRMWAVSAVVVDLPLVPVMATNGASGEVLARSRQKSSTSPMISTPAARALVTVQCGAGWVNGTPGASTRAANRLQSASAKSSTAKPAAVAASRPAALSSAATTVAPPAASARAAAKPDLPRPKTATALPANVVTAIMAAILARVAVA